MAYMPSTEEAKARHKLYKNLDKMRQLKNEKLPHFAGPEGNRSFLEYIDDSERILNGYTMTRESQGKEDWQSNMLDNVARPKLRAIASGLALRVPDIKCKATNTDGMPSPHRAEFAKYIAKQTFQDGNPTLHNFLLVWHLLSHGIVVEYDGYKTGGSKIRRVKSFDSRTGAIEEETVYVEGKGRPFNAILNPQEFYWWDMHTRDIQDQPRIAWVQHYTKKELEQEFSKYPNYKHVRNKRECSSSEQLQKTLYFDTWSKRVEMENDYELVREYSKEDDSYEVWCHGVPLIRAPLIWGHEEKYYPFSKAIAEPFGNTNHFCGLSFPGLLENYSDTKNTVINTMIDKLYRSMDPAWLIGLQNKDLLDAESQFEGGDGRYYVPDVDAVKPVPVQGINQGELAFLQVLDRGIEGLSIDRNQQGLESTGDRTLGEVQLADQRARELKGMLYIFLEDLWLQKYKLRTRTILTHYLKDKAARKDTRDAIISINDFRFRSGEQGRLDIHVAENENTLLSEADIEARDSAAEQMGETYKIVSMPVSYMDDYHLDFETIPGSFHNQERIKEEAEFDSEVMWMVQFDPEFFLANKDRYREEKLAFRGKSMEDFNPPAPAMPMLPGATPDAGMASPAGAPMPQGQPPML